MRQRPVIEALEPRILYSADIGLALGLALNPPDAGHEIVVIDSRVPDLEILVRDIAQQGRTVVMLDAERDALEQISAALAGRENVSALHIISHGGDGVLQLGSDQVTAGALERNSNEVEGWRRALATDADILLYGCDVAATTQGQLLVDTLARLTGADVAASSDATGSAQSGGDWDFEHMLGEIQTQIAVSAHLQEWWKGVLAAVMVTTTDDQVDGDTSSIAALLLNPGALGQISLREALIATNATSGADTISLAAGTYTLSRAGLNENAASTGDLDITDDLTINGAGANTTFIDGADLDRVFDVRGATVAMAGLTIQNGSVDDGAGMYVDGSSSVTIRNSALSGNAATGNGGAMFLSGTLVLDGVTIDGNTANHGGGIYVNNGASATLTNVTVSGNTAASDGGGILARNDVDIINSTIAYNSASSGGGIQKEGSAEVSLRNTILAHNTGGNANGAMNSLGNNIESSNTAGLNGTGDQINTDPLLGPLQYNGGETKSHALLAGSPAINPAGLSGAPAVDQRGYTRDATPDIGAYELGGTPPLAGFWITTEGNVASPSGVNGLDSWVDGDVLQFSDPDLALEPGGSDGTLSLVFNMDQFAANGTAEIDAIHYVSRNITVAGMQLLAGDVLFSTVLIEDFTSSNTLLDVADSDLVVFRPDVAGDYSAGTFLMLLDESAVTGGWLDLAGIALVEANTVVGNTTLQAGSFILLEGGSASRKNIQLFTPSSVGATTDGTLQELFNGLEAGTGTAFDGLDLLEETTTIGGTTLAAGTILVSQDNSASISCLTVSTTELGGTGVSAGTLTLLMDGPAVGLNMGNENIFALTLLPGSASTNNAPVITSDGGGSTAAISIAENTTAVTTVAATDADLPAQALTYSIAGGADAARFLINGSTGVLSFLAAPDFESPADAGANNVYDVIVEVSDGSLTDTQAIAVTVTPVNDAPSATITAATFAASEQTSLSLVAGGLSVADLDGPSVTATLSVGEGVLDVTAGTTGATVANSGTGTVTISGTQGQINALLAGNSGATVAYTNGSDTPSASTTLTLSASDGTLSASDTATLNITALNDAPSATITAATFAASEQTSLSLVAGGLSVADLDGPSVTATLSVGEGVLDVTAGTTGATVVNSGTATVTISGTQAQINALLAGASGASVLYTNGSDTPSASTTLTLSASDGTLSASDTATINITAVNDAPVLNTAQLTVSEGGTRVFAPADFTLTDPDSAAFTYTVSGVAGGSFEVFNGASWNAAASFTTAQLTAGAVRFVDDGNEAAPSFSVTASDGTANSNTLAATVTYTAVNDAPTATIGPVGYGVVEDDGPRALGGVSVGDADAGTGQVAVTLAVGNGQLTLGTTSGLTFTGGANSTASMTFTATVANANSALATLTYQPDADFSGMDTLSLSVDDQGNTGGGALTASDTASITVSPVNDAPSATITATTFTATEQTGLSLVAGGLSVTDVDGPGVTATLAVGEGVLDVTAGTTGATVTNSGTATVTISGTQAQINAVLAGNGGATLVYTDGSDTPSASTTLTLSASDGTLSASDTATINITAANDAPVLNAAQLTVSEGGTRVFAPADFSVTDPDSAAFTYTLSSAAGGSFQVFDGTSWNAATTFTTAQLAAGEVRFVDDGDETAPSFSVTASDGTTNSNTLAATVTYTPANDAPVLNAAQLTVGEGGTTVLAPADFNLTDPDSAAFTYTVSGVAGGGFQVFDGTSWNAATTFTTAQLAAGEVRFVDDGDEAAPSFSVTASDGTTNSNTLAATVTYTGVNDAPVLNTAQLTVSEGGTRVFAPADFGITDPDSTAFTFTASGVAGGGFQVFDGTSWNAATTFTTAQLAAGEVRFVDDGDEAAPSFSVTASDGTTNSNTLAATVTYTGVNDAPSATITATAFAATEQTGLSLVGGGLSVSDVDGPGVQATLSVGEGVLDVTAGTTGATVANSGTATVTISGTQAQINALLAGASGASVLYTDGSDTPSASTTLTLSASDGTLSASDTATINITAANDAPVLNAAQLTVGEGGTTVLAPADFNLTDPDSTAFTFTASGVAGGGFQVFDGTSWNAATTFTTAQLAAGEVRFVDDGDEVAPSFSVTASDGAANSNTLAATVTYTSVNDAPVLNTATLSVSQGQTSTLSGASFGITDPDDASFTYAASGVTGGYFQLSSNAGVAITSFTSADLAGGLVQFVDDGDAAAPAFSVTVNDGDVDSNTLAASVSFTPAAPNAPVADLNAGGVGQDVTVAFTEQTPVLIAPAGTLTDVDSANLASLMATLTARPDGDAVESLSLNAAATAAASGAGLTVSYTTATGVLSITGSASVATYQTILQGIQYNNTSDAPSTGNRAVTVAANDGALPSMTQTSTAMVTAANDAPVLNAAQLTVGEGGTTVLAPADFNLTDPDNTAFTFTASGVAGGGFQVFDGTSWNAATTFTTAQLAAGEVRFVHDGAEAAPSFSVTASDGAASSSTLAATVTYTGVNDAPALNAVQLASGEGGTTVLAPADFNVTDPDSTAFTFTASGVAGGGFQVFDGASWNAATTFTTAQLAAGEVRFVHNGAEAAPSFSATASDGAAGSNALAAAVTYALVNDTPVATASGTSATFTAGSSAVAVDAALAVIDPDNATLASATVAITGGFQAAEDRLSFTSDPATMGNIAATYDAASGVLTLSSAGASATLAQWQAALGSVTYANTAAAPGGANRMVSIAISDGGAVSPTVSVALNVASPAPGSAPLPPTGTSPATPPVIVPTPPPAAIPGASSAATPAALQPAAPAPQARATPAVELSFEATGELQIPVVNAGGGGHAQSAAAGASGVPGVRPGVSASAGPAAESEPDLLADVARQAQSRWMDLLQPDEQGRSGAIQALNGALARLHENARPEEEIQSRTVVVLAAGSLSMTLAYLLWLVRGGALAASVLAALPAWRLVDPLPVLPRARDDEPDEAAEDDEAIAAFAEAPAQSKHA